MEEYVEPKADESDMRINEERTRAFSEEEMNKIASTQNEILTADSIEHVTGLPANDNPIYLNLHFQMDIKEGELEPKTLNTSIFGRIKGMFDSGASINCIRTQYAYKYYRKYIRKQKDFYCTTANGAIIINEYIPLQIKSKGKWFITKFYLLNKSPYRFIISRSLFTKLGYKIIDPDGNEFNMKSQYEEMDPEFYEEFYKHMDYDIGKMKEFIQYIQAHTHAYKKNTQTTFGIAQTLKDPGYLHEVCMVGEDQAQINRSKRANEEQKDPTKDIDFGHIEDKQIRTQFTEMIYSDKAKERNSKNSRDIGTIPGIEFKIELKPGSQPVAKKPYPMSYDQSKIVRDQVSQLHDDKIVRRSSSQFAWPVILVPKPTRKGIQEWRMCVDVRGLNAMTVKDKYRIPSMRDLYRRLSGNKIFSNFDLRSAYYHIPIREEDKHKTAFITDDGQLWEWNRMAFGFCNAPAVFQRAMDEVFKDLEFVVVYLDDIIVCSKTEREHLRHLKLVYERLHKYQLKLRIEKCKFFMRELKFLGIIVNADGIRCDPGYVNEVLKFKRPANVKEIERFIGMITWLGRFIPNLSKLTAKLNELRKKDKGFTWTSEHDRHFEAILRAVSEAKLLRHPDIHKPFFVQTDASDKAIGAVLLQDFGNGYLEPIEFISRKFKESEMKWHASEKELVAIVWALKKWIRYLLPNHFTVFTDHKNLQYLFSYTGHKLSKLQRWMIFLQQFDFTAKFLPGKQNFIADYLSRDNQLDKRSIQQIIHSIEETRYQMLPIRINKEKFLKWEQHQYKIPNDIGTHTIIPVNKRPRRNPAVYNKYYGPEIWEPETYGQMKQEQHNKYIRDDPVLINKPTKEETNRISKELEQKQEEQDWSLKLNPERLVKEQKADPTIQQIAQQLQAGPKEPNEQINKDRLFINNEGVVFKKTPNGPARFYVPQSCIEDVVNYCHSGNNFYHQGVTRTTSNIEQNFYWPNIQRDVERVIGECTHCKLKNARHDKTAGLKHPILASRVFEQVCIDIVGPLPVTSCNNRYLLTIIDRFSRYVEAIPLQFITAEAIANAYIDNWLCRYGRPESLLSDNGTQFTSRIFSLVQRITNVRHKFTTPYHPQCNGMIERFHRFLKQRLALKASTHQLDYWDKDDWDTFIPAITFAYNATPHSTTRKTPYEVLYGNKARLNIDIPQNGEKEEFIGYDDYVFKLIRKLQIIRNDSFRTQYEFQQQLKRKLNKDRKPFPFKKGQWVMKRIMRTGNKAKLQFNYEGPYEIITQVGKGESYKIKEIQGDRLEISHGEHLIAWDKELHGDPKSNALCSKIEKGLIANLCLDATREQRTRNKARQLLWNRLNLSLQLVNRQL